MKRTLPGDVPALEARGSRDRICRAHGVGFFLVVIFASGLPAADSIDAVDELRWKSRLLLVFAADQRDPRVAAFDASIEKSSCPVRVRDLVIGRVFSSGESRIGGRRLGAAELARLRDSFGVDGPEFQVFLVGKDGGVKARYDSPPDLEAVFTLIDGMPMRQRERRSQATRCNDWHRG